ncbi:relaxase/mobilization nuclease domain-containing protein [Pyruvatibacter mobilis]|uniref:relaxase/mobilization nuclease domain-containing protein n=1 Tax=Pyruvatibacter mobilis TaxID=1712261 RepID=UPI003BB10C7E
MILKAKERGGAPQLARYLMSMRDNEHVELHNVRGFVSDDLRGAFSEADAIAKGTRCKNYLFSMSINPPANEKVRTEDFELAIERIEQKLGLEDQPRAIVFHEKDGRRHAHVVWSRIDSERMRALNMAHYKMKLRDVSRELFMEHGWDMPRGLQDRALRDPLNFSQEEWQQARRAGIDPREIKSVLRQCWERSDNGASFERALKERGFWLARGDRRGFVAIDYRGEVYSLSRYAGVKVKELDARIGNPSRLRSVDQTKAEIAQGITDKLKTFIADTQREATQRHDKLATRKAELAARHHTEREKLKSGLERRWQAEAQSRAGRLPKGFSGIWHRLTGQYAKIRKQNEREAFEAYRRDRAATDDLIFRQLEERGALQTYIRAERSVAQQRLALLREDVANYGALENKQRRKQDDGMRPQVRRNRRERRSHQPDFDI